MSERIEAARAALESGRVKLMLPGAVRDALLGLLDEFDHLARLVENLRLYQEEASKKAVAAGVVAAAASVQVHEKRHHPSGLLEQQEAGGNGA